MANVIEIIIRARDQSQAAVNQAAAGLSGLKSSASGVPEGLGAITSKIGPLTIAAGIGAAALTAAAVATKGFLDTVKQGADAGDALNRIAQQTGLTVEEVSRLSFAASQSNTSIESLNTGIRFLSRNLFEAQRGGKEQAETLRELGFSGQEAQGHLGGTSEALSKISDRLRAVQDPGTRTALAMRLFGRSAQEIVPFLSQGSAAIRELGDEADRSGITVTTAAGKLGDAYNDSIQKINQQFTGLKTVIAEAALPALIEFTEVASRELAKVIAFVKENREAFEAFAELLASAGKFTIEITVKGLGLINDAIKLVNDLKAVFKSAQDLFKQGLTINIATLFNRASKAGVDASRSAEPSRAEVLGRQPVGRSFGDVSTTTRPQPLGPTDDDLKRMDEARKRQEAFNKTLAESYLVADKFSFTMKDAGNNDIEASIDDVKQALGVETATKLIATMQAGLKDIASKPLEIRVKTVNEITETRAQGPPTQDGRFPVADSIVKIKTELDTSALQELEDIEVDLGLGDLDKTTAGLIQVRETLEAAGVSAKGIEDALAAGSEAGVLMAAGFETAFAALRDSLDPVKNLVSDMGQAAFELGQAIGDTVSTAFKNLVQDGHKFIDVLGNFAKALGTLAIKFLADIAAAIAKALVLKAIMGAIGGPVSFFVSKGGEVAGAARGGEARATRQAAAHMNLGGSIARASAPRPVYLNAGGSVVRAQDDERRGPIAYLHAGGSIVSNTLRTVATHLAGGGSFASSTWNSSNVVHAAGGVRIMPGSPQAYDSIPAMLSPGEVVLPTIGGRAPGDLLANLAQLGQDLTSFMARSFVPMGTAPQMAMAGGGNTYNIHALDAASIRTMVRRGDLRNESILADDPARD